MNRPLPLAETKKNLSSIISDVEGKHERFTITKNGMGKAVILSREKFGSRLETLQILSNKEEKEAIQRATKNVRDKKTVSLNVVKKRNGLK